MKFNFDDGKIANCSTRSSILSPSLPPPPPPSSLCGASATNLPGRRPTRHYTSGSLPSAQRGRLQLGNLRSFCYDMPWFWMFTCCILWWTYPVQSSLWCNHRAIQLKKISKNSEKNLECASQPTSSIYKISGSNSFSSRSYKKDKFSDKSNSSNAT